MRRKRRKRRTKQEKSKRREETSNNASRSRRWSLSRQLLLSLSLLFVLTISIQVKISNCDKKISRNNTNKPIADYEFTSPSNQSKIGEEEEEEIEANYKSKQQAIETQRPEQHLDSARPATPIIKGAREGNRSLRAATAYGNGGGSSEIELDAGQTGELSCYIFHTANSDANSSALAQQNSVDNLLASLDEPPSSYLNKKSSSAGHPRIDQDDDDWLVSLIFWYKDDNPSPIYTLDARHQVLANPVSRLPAGGTKNKLSSNEVLVDLLARARHYSASDNKYKLDTRGGSEIKLRISNTNETDSGQYKCRIDFRRWPTQSQVVKLSVKVPMSRPEIIVQGKQLNGTVVDLEEEQENVEFTCLVHHGSPKPQLSWLVQRHSHKSSSSSSNNNNNNNIAAATVPEVEELIGQEIKAESSVVASSKLRLAKIGRNLQDARLGCRASQPTWQTGRQQIDSQSTNLVLAGEKLLKADKMIDDSGGSRDTIARPHNEPPSPNSVRQVANSLQTEWIQLKLRLRPTKIEIVLASRPKTAVKLEQKNERLWLAEFDESSAAELQFNELFACQSWGSWPPARLVWRFATDFVVDNNDNIAVVSAADGIPDRNLLKLAWTKSGESVRMDSKLDGHEFVCSASNEHLSSSSNDTALEAKLKVSVRYKPQVRLTEERNNEIRLKCIVQSNPPINQIVWLVNEQPLAKIMPSQVSTTTNSFVESQTLSSSQRQQNHYENWRFAAREFNHNGKQYRLEGPDKLVLIQSDDEHNETDSYKCLAINIMGQQESEPLRVRLNYRPVCLSSFDKSRGNVADEMLFPALSKSIHQIMSDGTNVACPVESQPIPTRFHWSFVGLKEFAKLLGSHQDKKPDEIIKGLNHTTRWQLETNISDENKGHLQLTDLMKDKPPGVLLCRAENTKGLQQSPCLTLLNLASSESELFQPNCSLKARANQHHYRPSVWLEVSCAYRHDGVIYQLDINDEGETKRSLFSSDNEVHRISVLPHPHRTDNSSQQLHDGPVITLEKLKSEWFNSLKFTLRATNLISTSEPHAIYGREIQLIPAQIDEATDEDEEGAHVKSNPQQAVQVLRSATSELHNLDLGSNLDTSAAQFQPQQQQQRSISTSTSSLSRSQAATSVRQPTSGSLLPKGDQEYEKTIAIATVAGIFVLSLLTLTLILLLLLNSSSRHSRQQEQQLATVHSPNSWLDDSSAKVQGSSEKATHERCSILRRLFRHGTGKRTANAGNINTDSNTTTTTTAPGSDTVDSQLELELRPASGLSFDQQPMVPRLVIREQCSPAIDLCQLTPIQDSNFLAPAKVRTADAVGRQYFSYDRRQHQRIYIEPENQKGNLTARRSSYLSLVEPISTRSHPICLQQDLHQAGEDLYVINPQDCRLIPSTSSASATSVCQSHSHQQGDKLHHLRDQNRPQAMQQQQVDQYFSHRVSSCCCSPAATCDSSSLHCDNSSSLATTSNLSHCPAHQLAPTLIPLPSDLSFLESSADEEVDKIIPGQPAATSATSSCQQSLGGDLFLFSFL